MTNIRRVGDSLFSFLSPHLWKEKIPSGDTTICICCIYCRKFHDIKKEPCIRRCIATHWINSNVVLSRAFALLIVFSIVAVRFTDCCIQLRFAQERERFVVNLLITLLVCVRRNHDNNHKKNPISLLHGYLLYRLFEIGHRLSVFLLRLYQMCGRTNKKKQYYEQR